MEKHTYATHAHTYSKCVVQAYIFAGTFARLIIALYIYSLDSNSSALFYADETSNNPPLLLWASFS